MPLERWVRQHGEMTVRVGDTDAQLRAAPWREPPNLQGIYVLADSQRNERAKEALSFYSHKRF